MYRMITAPVYQDEKHDRRKVQSKEELMKIAGIIKKNSSELSIMEHKGTFMLVENDTIINYKRKFIDPVGSYHKRDAKNTLISNLKDTRRLIQEGATIELV